MGRIVWALAILLIVASCKSSKKVVASGSYKAPQNLAEFEKLAATTRNMPEFLNLRAGTQFKGNGISQKLNLTMRMKRDELLWASVTVPTLGLEVLRMLADKDSVRIISYLENEYVAEAWDYMTRYTGNAMGISDMQDLLLAQPFLKRDAAAQYRIEGDAITIRSTNPQLKSTEAILASMLRLILLETVSSDNQTSLQLIYTNHMPFGPMYYAGGLSLTGKNGGNAMELRMDINRIDSVGGVGYPFAIPGSYTRKQ